MKMLSATEAVVDSSGYWGISAMTKQQMEDCADLHTRPPGVCYLSHSTCFVAQENGQQWFDALAPTS